MLGPTTNKMETSQKNNDLRAFLRLLEKEKDLIIIKKCVEPKFEIAAIESKLEGGTGNII